MATLDAQSRVMVCDAGPLIYLDELASLDLLSDFSEVLVPTAVWLEVMRHRPVALPHAGIPLRQIEINESLPADLEATARLFALHTGELQALHIFKQQAADLFLTDDTAAGLAARSLGITAHGTIGILLRSIRRRQRTADQVIQTLKSLPEASTLHIRKSLLDEIVQSMEKSR